MPTTTFISALQAYKKYVEVKSWDNGYLVVMADYDGMGLRAEYIDLIPILQNLYIKPETFLKDIQTVKIGDSK